MIFITLLGTLIGVISIFLPIKMLSSEDEQKDFSWGKFSICYIMSFIGFAVAFASV